MIFIPLAYYVSKGWQAVVIAQLPFLQYAMAAVGMLSKPANSLVGRFVFLREINKKLKYLKEI
jgi:hypothetical protein